LLLLFFLFLLFIWQIPRATAAVAATARAQCCSDNEERKQYDRNLSDVSRRFTCLDTIINASTLQQAAKCLCTVCSKGAGGTGGGGADVNGGGTTAVLGQKAAGASSSLHEEHALAACDVVNVPFGQAVQVFARAVVFQGHTLHATAPPVETIPGGHAMHSCEK
jgi:hypothetical protein